MFLLSENQPKFEKIQTVCKLLLRTIFVAGLVFELAGCGDKSIWTNHGDSCINISETPPLKRVINYTDHDLCERKLSPRKAPNPQTRPNNLKD